MNRSPSSAWSFEALAYTHARAASLIDTTRLTCVDLCSKTPLLHFLHISQLTSMMGEFMPGDSSWPIPAFLDCHQCKISSVFAQFVEFSPLHPDQKFNTPPDPRWIWAVNSHLLLVPAHWAPVVICHVSDRQPTGCQNSMLNCQTHVELRNVFC